MKKLEDKIIKKIFVMETKNTFLSFLARIVLFTIFGFLIVVFGQATIEIFKEQRTFDLLNLFNEDIEIIKRYFLDVIYTFYQETPKIVFILLVVSLFLFLFLIWITFKKRHSIINRIKSLFRFWTHK